MGFCRRCGEIVSGTRCKCGGMAVGTFVLSAHLRKLTAYAQLLSYHGASHNQKRRIQTGGRRLIYTEKDLPLPQDLLVRLVFQVQSQLPRRLNVFHVLRQTTMCRLQH